MMTSDTLDLPGMEPIHPAGLRSVRGRIAVVAALNPSLDDDPMGEAFCEAHSAAERRPFGITLTPAWLVAQMLKRAAADQYDTIVDCGAGSGRFALAAARACPRAHVLAVESHPQMARLLRERVQQSGLASRIAVIEGDFRTLALQTHGRTLWLGNPPYVRHHDIAPAWKDWYRQGMAGLGIAASQLAGLHAHFMLRAVQQMRAGDGLCFVTAAEWLDNRYGQALRRLCLAPGLRVEGLWLADADDAVFDDALVSAAVLQLCADNRVDGAQLGRIAGRGLHTLRRVAMPALAQSPRWSEFAREHMPELGTGTALGDLFRITRGQVTGLNTAWVLPAHQRLLPERLTVPAVTRAREIIDDVISRPADLAQLKRVACLPRDLDTLMPDDRLAADAFIVLARRAGADKSYVAMQRRPWHWLDLREPPAALVSYMGRRPPVFRANPQRLTFLNIAHGLYPRQPLPSGLLPRLLSHLNQAVDVHSGRVYGGGLVKFEPSDIARLRLPMSWMDTSR